MAKGVDRHRGWPITTLAGLWGDRNRGCGHKLVSCRTVPHCSTFDLLASFSLRWAPASPSITVRRPSPKGGIFRRPSANSGSNPSPRCWASPCRAKSKSIIVRLLVLSDRVRLHRGQKARTPLPALEFSRRGRLPYSNWNPGALFRLAPNYVGVKAALAALAKSKDANCDAATRSICGAGLR
jgi:hypothetical protein